MGDEESMVLLEYSPPLPPVWPPPATHHREKKIKWV